MGISTVALISVRGSCRRMKKSLLFLEGESCQTKLISGWMNASTGISSSSRDQKTRWKSEKFHSIQNESPCDVHLWKNKIIGPYFFEDCNGQAVTVNGQRYHENLTDFFIPAMNEMNVSNHFIQQDDATCHTTRPSMEILRAYFPGNLFSQFDTSCGPLDSQICLRWITSFGDIWREKSTATSRLTSLNWKLLFANKFNWSPRTSMWGPYCSLRCYRV